MHTHLVDEMFQFPKGKNDDVLDGLWYAVNKARPPISKSLKLLCLKRTLCLKQYLTQLKELYLGLLVKKYKKHLHSL